MAYYFQPSNNLIYESIEANVPALQLQLFIASTRPGRKGAAVGAWALDQARRHGKFHVEAVDLAEVGLPMFDEPKHPKFADYEHEHTKRWSALVSRGDAYLFVTPEYDHAPPASLINAWQYLVKEWAYKACAFVSYGGVSAGTRGVAISKQIVVSLKCMPMFETVAIPFFDQYIDTETGAFNPGDVQAKAAMGMLDELHRWASALAPMRQR